MGIRNDLHIHRQLVLAYLGRSLLCCLHYDQRYNFDKMNSVFECKKARFASQKDVLDFVKKKNERGVQINYSRPYLCPLCGAWHFTTRPDKSIISELKKEIDFLKVGFKHRSNLEIQQSEVYRTLFKKNQALSKENMQLRKTVLELTMKIQEYDRTRPIQH